MDAIISRIIEIDAAAAAIVEDVTAQKQEIAAQMQEKTTAYDQEVEKDTQDTIQAMQQEMEKSLAREMEKLRLDTSEQMKFYESDYQSHHQQMAQEILASILEE